MLEQDIIGRMWHEDRCPPKKVRWWCDDGQGGGWIEHISQKENTRRLDILSRLDNGEDVEHLIDWE